MRGWNLSPWSQLRRSGLVCDQKRDLSRMIRPTDPGLLANLIKTHRLSLSLISLLKQLKIFYVADHPALSSFRKQWKLPANISGATFIRRRKNKSPFFALHVLSNCLTTQNEWIVTSFLRYSTGIRLSYATLFATCITLFVTCFAFLWCVL